MRSVLLALLLLHLAVANASAGFGYMSRYALDSQSQATSLGVWGLVRDVQLDGVGNPPGFSIWFDPASGWFDSSSGTPDFGYKFRLEPVNHYRYRCIEERYDNIDEGAVIGEIFPDSEGFYHSYASYWTDTEHRFWLYVIYDESYNPVPPLDTGASDAEKTAAVSCLLGAGATLAFSLAAVIPLDHAPLEGGDNT